MPILKPMADYGALPLVRGFLIEMAEVLSSSSCRILEPYGCTRLTTHLPAATRRYVWDQPTAINDWELASRGLPDVVATPTHPGLRMGGRPPPLPGTIRSLPPAATVALMVAAIAVGWFLPLFGLSLLAFLLIDPTIAALKRRTTNTATPNRKTN